MCGIAGVLFGDRDRMPEQSQLKAMGDAIAHRGPDAEGYWAEPGIGLVHRRLSIIDLAGGDQPIANEDGRLQVIFNGEIYNYRELRGQLEGRGHHLKTRSDTEVLVHLYEDMGEELVSRLRGMFAFAIWDRAHGRLLLGRDRLGIKPLYLYRDSEMLLFASEPKAILAWPGVDRSVDPLALEEYLAYGIVPGQRSIFRRIQKLPPAHIVHVDRERLDRPPRRYWQLQICPRTDRSPQEWQEAVRDKVDQAVKAHLIADVPVGAFLSGGIDSSVVVACAAAHTKGPLQTFSMGFREQAFSELPFAREVARWIGTSHFEEIVTPDATQLVDELSYFYDEPFADASAIPTYMVSRLARRSVKVVLSGDGGDEAFGGYARYAHDLHEAALRRMLPRWLRRWALRPLAHIWPKADWLPRPLRAKTRLTNLALDDPAAYANTLSICRQPLRRRLLADEIRAELDGHRPEKFVIDGFARAPAGDALAGMIAADVEMLLPDDFLVKTDRASMAHGLELRPPLLDHELLELAAQIPSSLKVHRGETKWIFKQSFQDQLPASILGRPKQGFDIPINEWLRGPLREMFEDSVLASGSAVSQYISQPVAARIYRAHLSGLSAQGNLLWSLLILSRWADRFLGSSCQLVPPPVCR